MRIGELSEATGLSTKAIRYYEEAGLIPEPPRTSSGYRDYTEDWADRIRFIRTAQSAGFTLGEIGQILAHSDRGERPCEAVTEIIAARIAEIDRKVDALATIRARLAELSKGAASRTCSPDDRYCRIIATTTTR